jgi:hypothetical protein
MAVVDAWHKGYGDLPGACAPEATQPCNGPDIARLVEEGNRYVQEEFPEMDFITKCVEIPPGMVDQRHVRVSGGSSVRKKKRQQKEQQAAAEEL